MLKKEYNPFRLKKMFGDRCILEKSKDGTKYRGSSYTGETLFTIEVNDELNICKLKVVPHLGGETHKEKELFTRQISFAKGERPAAVEEALNTAKKVAKSIKLEAALLSATVCLCVLGRLTFVLGLALPTIILDGLAGLTGWLFLKEKEYWGRESRISILMKAYVFFTLVQIALVASVI